LATVPFDDFQKGLLDALAGHIARDRDILRRAGDFVDFVNVDDAPLGALLVSVGVLEKLQQDVLHVLADVAGLRQRRGVGQSDGHVDDARQGLSQQRLARSRGA
jgi:hypothetical protein